jgi:hypothetical protein
MTTSFTPIELIGQEFVYERASLCGNESLVRGVAA